MSEKGIDALIAAAREMADAIEGKGSMVRAALRFRLLDDPDCPHGCIGGVEIVQAELKNLPGEASVLLPCPLHGVPTPPPQEELMPEQGIDIQVIEQAPSTERETG